MRTLAVLLLTTAALATAPADALAQCELLSKDGKCDTQPTFKVRFAPAQSELTGDAPAQPKPARVHVVPTLSGPIDCGILRRADPSIDPLIVREPPKDRHYTMRVIEVPSCHAAR